MRDGVSLLDQCASAAGGAVTLESVYASLGLAGERRTAELMQAIAQQDTAKALTVFSSLYAAGKDVGALLGEMCALCRDLLVLHTAPKSGLAMLSGIATEQQALALQDMFSPGELMRVLTETQVTLRGGGHTFTFDRGKRTATLDGARYYLHEPATMNALGAKDSALIRQAIVRPTPPPARATILLDPGHGAGDTGCRVGKTHEKNITLAVALEVKRLLEAQGHRVLMTRAADGPQRSLEERAQMGAANAIDAFVSIHVNAHEDRGINGFETYYLDISRDPRAVRVASQENARNDRNLGEVQKILSDGMLTARQYESRRLATDIQKQSLARLKRRGYTVRDNGTRAAPFIVLLGARMPCVLVEVGYCSNPHEARNLLDARYRMILAEGLAEGILSYSDRVRQNRTAQNSLTPPASGAM